MGRLKRILFFFAFILLGVSIGCAFFWDNVTQWIYVLRRGYSEREYIQVAADTDGSICAAYWKTADQLGLRFFDADGNHPYEWAPNLPAEAEAGHLSALYPLGNDTVFLAIYEQNSTSLNVYRAKKGAATERLLRRDIEPTGYAKYSQYNDSSEYTLTARRDTCRIGTFSRQQDEIYFTLIESRNTVRASQTTYGLSGIGSGKIESYACSAAGGLRKLGEQELKFLFSNDTSTFWHLKNVPLAAVLPNGGLAITGTGNFTVDGTPLEADYANSNITQMAVSGSDLYYLDSADGTVYYTDLSAMHVRQLLHVNRGNGASVLTDLALTPSGEVLLLEDGWNLTRLHPGGSISLSHALYPGKAQSMAILGAFLFFIILVDAVVRYVFFVRRRGNVPMALYWSFVVLSVGMTLGVFLHYGIMLPDARSSRADLFDITIRSEAENGENVSAYSEEMGWALHAYNVDSLEGLDFSDVHGAEQIVAIWSEEKQGYFTRKGEPAELIPGFCALLADEARQTQGSARMYSLTRYATAFARGDITVTFILFTDTRRPPQPVEPYTMGALAILMLTVILVLTGVGASVRRLGRGLERYSRQEPWVRLRMETSDELEGIASSLNSMAIDREVEERNRNRMVESYRRFVPEHVLNLLGRRSILDVDKGTYASRTMALLRVWFTFPDSVYSVSSNSRLLFDSVNAVIERTAPIATRQGGTVFNYAYYGYDVVMENDPARVVSTAVVLQQEALAFNEFRAREGLPTVTFRIALDVGNVMFGVVGDSAHMQPTALSSGFTTVRELIGLCGQLDAGILCTEAIAPGLKQYGSRFIGKRRTENGVLRVYEIFDGDPYEMRKGKETTLSRFYQAVMAYYSGDCAQAKRIFLELAHETPRDGGVRHYLYLADRVDGSPEQAESFGL
ncbi:MAG: hypothetical protein IJ617_07660 [Oscillospiraceae bacterium]|nr:hypothetical protein [Oscillospiraceae bacterium]